MGVNVDGGDKKIYDGICKYNLGQRAHVLKHLHGRFIIETLKKIYHEGNLWRGYRSIISFVLHKSIFMHFHYKGDTFTTDI